MALRRALHFVFKVGDRTKTATFYRDVLGMKVEELFVDLTVEFQLDYVNTAGTLPPNIVDKPVNDAVNKCIFSVCLCSDPKPIYKQ